MLIPGLSASIGSLTGESDRYFDDVLLLMHFDTSTTAQSQLTPITFNVVGDPSITSSPKLFGDGSIKFDGTGDNLNNSNSTFWDFGTGDWTVEAAFYTTEKNNNRGVIDIRNSTTSIGPLLETTDNNGGSLRMRCNGDSYQVSISNSSWYRIAFSRVGNKLYFFVNGTLIDLTSSSGFVWSDVTGVSFSSNEFTLGTYVDQRGTGTNYHFNGNVDEVRITKGVGRYDASYVLASGPFPDS